MRECCSCLINILLHRKALIQDFRDEAKCILGGMMAEGMCRGEGIQAQFIKNTLC